MLGLVASLLLQVPPVAQPGREKRTIVRDSAVDSTRLPPPNGRGRGRAVGHRLPVTAAVLATAFKDPAARPLLMRARAARLALDSALESYDATAYQRMSVFMHLGESGREHPMFINESAIRIQWKSGVGAWVDMRGARSAIPIAPPEAADDELASDLSSSMMTPIPYFPRSDPLWVGSSGSIARAEVDDADIVHPIADGAEAYYTYETADSMSFTLPDGRTTHLRALLVRPRSAKWNLAIGTLWFDVSTGQLIRAAYRLSVPLDLTVNGNGNEVTVGTSDTTRGGGGGVGATIAKAVFSPLRAQITAVALEYGLYKTRFWLPRVRTMEGMAQVSFMHVPIRIEHSFRYTSVNETATLPAIHLPPSYRQPVRLDTLDVEQRRRYIDSSRVARAALRDSLNRGLRHRWPQCDTASYRVVTAYRYGDARLPVAIKIPCDIESLKHSAELPPSIYDPNDALFDAKERDALIAEALSLGAQPPFMLGALPRPTYDYGVHLTRYNRVEGFSTGVRIDEQIGGGYSASVLGRYGLADGTPNGELTLTRTNLTKSVHLSGYSHLVSASDWGHSLSFGTGLSALLWGRDEGFYYRAAGAELGGGRDAPVGSGARVAWRLFVEQQRTAWQNVGNAVFGTPFEANIVATPGTFVGGGMTVHHSYGIDPNGFRLLTDGRLETARGDSLYGRAALEMTASRGLGPVAGALTLSGGTSVGALPRQRWWLVGGLNTVRGQSPDTAQSGNAYWLTRIELGTNGAGAVHRTILFSDLGWAGDRTKLSQVGRPLSGVGVGTSMLDGMIRLDVARGLFPRKQWRTDLYLEAKF